MAFFLGQAGLYCQEFGGERPLIKYEINFDINPLLDKNIIMLYIRCGPKHEIFSFTFFTLAALCENKLDQSVDVNKYSFLSCEKL